MAAEAEAAREARAKVIVAEGEQKASRALKGAAEVITQSPSALQLRYLQTLNSIAAEKNSTIVFPLPIDLLSSFLHRPPPKPAETPSAQRKIRACCLYKYPEQQTSQQSPTAPHKPQQRQGQNQSWSSDISQRTTAPASMRESPAYHASPAGTSVYSGDDATPSNYLLEWSRD
ncbi:PHB domain-containing protein [Aphelenchoides fujianensis]|nr:PHB domain-containing protein [Aphelenchoides fujianensis]